MMTGGNKKPQEEKTGTPANTRPVRKAAEKKLKETPGIATGLDSQTPEQLIHELRVHQTELETQAEELNRTRLELEESRDKYLDLYEFAPVGYLTLTEKGLVADVNLTGATLLGVTRKKLGKARFSTFVAPEDSGQWVRYFMSMLENGGKQTCTLTLKRGDGSTFPARIEGGRISDSNNGAHTVTLTIGDISDIRATEVALAEREELFRSVVYNSSDVTVLTDANGNITFVSPQCEKVLGYPADTFIGQTLPGIIHPDDIAGCREKWEQVAQQGLGLHDYEYRIIDARGGVRWISHSASLTLVNGRVLGMQNNIRDITERKKAGETLRESETKYREVIENANEAIVVVQDEKIVYANPRAEEIVQATLEDITSRPFVNFIHPDDRELVTDRYQRRLSGEEGQENYDFRLFHPPGNPVWVQISAVRIVWNGRPATLNFLTDITRRKTAEENLQRAHYELEDQVRQRTADLYTTNMQLKKEIEERNLLSSALRESEERFRRIFETLDDVYYRADMEGKVTDVSPSCRKLLGWTPDELIGTPIENLYDNPSERRVFLSDLQKTGSVYDYEVTLKHRDGRPVPISVNVHLIFDTEGYPIALEGTFRDITERKQAEVALAGSELKFRDFFNNATDAIVIHDMQGHFTEVNDVICTRLGYSREELLRLSPVDIDDSEHGVMVMDRLRDLQETGHSVFETVHLAKDGTRIPTEVSSRMITYDGRPAIISTGRDITDRKQAEDALQRQATIMAILNEVITTANRAGNLDEVTEKIVDEIIHLLDYDAGGIYLVDPDNTTATIIYSKNIPPAFLEEVKTVSIVNPPYNILFTEGTPIITAHYDEVDRDRSKLSGFLSLATVPIVSREKTIGSLNVASRKRGEISGQEKQILLTIGQELGSTIERLKAFRESENAARNLMTLFDSVNEMVFVLDMQGLIITVNHAVKTMLLYTEEELAGTDVLHLHVPERRDEALQNVQGMIAGTIDSCPVPILTKDGRRIEVETIVTRGTWNNQEVLIGVSRDITERKRAEEALKKNEELLNLAITGSGAGLWDWNVQTGETHFNERWAEIAGYTLEELQPVSIATWTMLAHPDDLRYSDELLRQHFLGEIPDYECEVRIKHKDGHWIWVLNRGRVTQWDNDGKPLRMTGTQLDISHRKALEVEIEFHEQELMQHSARLSHEIDERRRIEDEIRIINQELETRVRERTNELAETVRKLQDENAERKRMEDLIRLTNRKLALMNEVSYQDIQNKITALRGFVTICQKADGEEVRQEYYKKQENTLKNIHNLIKNTRDYQKLGVEKYQWVDMEKAVRMAGLPPDSGVSLAADLQGLFIYSDPQVSRVFDILFENAVQHGKKVTRIAVSWKEAPGGIAIVCEDDGGGILPGQKDRIFERVVAGEGKFGLFFVHELLTLSGMTIQETGEPGLGTRFEVTVPKGLYRFTKTGE